MSFTNLKITTSPGSSTSTLTNDYDADADTDAYTPTNRLTSAERKALSKSDHKASKVLGIMLTRNGVGQEHRHRDRKLALLPCLAARKENLGCDGGGGGGGGGVDAHGKRVRNRKARAATLIGPLKHLGLGRAVGMGKGLVEKRNKKRTDEGFYTHRVVLGPLHLNESPGSSMRGSSSTVGSDDMRCSFLELDGDGSSKTPRAGDFMREKEDEEDDILGAFEWDVEDPFAAPPNLALERHFEMMKHGENIGPLDAVPYAPMMPFPFCKTPSVFDGLVEEEEVKSPGDAFDDLRDPLERAYLDFLIAQDEANEELIERSKQKREALRSRNKMLDVLGVEARQFVDRKY